MNDPIPIRTSWLDLPDVILHASETAVKQHMAYTNAKAGDSDAAFQLVQDTISPEAVAKIIDLAAGNLLERPIQHTSENCKHISDMPKKWPSPIQAKTFDYLADGLTAFTPPAGLF